MTRWVLVLAVVCLARASSAEAPGADALVRGIRAFESREYKTAARLFENALARGGLTRAQTLTAYIDLGSTQVALGKTSAASRAFEQAALIDPKFVVPPHSGRQATTLANQAKRKQEGIGPYKLEVGAPGEVKAEEPFKITIEMTDDQTALVSLVRVVAKEPSGKEFETIEPVAAHFTVEIPADIAEPGAQATVRIELLDAHSNRLATAEKTVHVEDKATTPAPAKTPPPKDEPQEPPKDEPKEPPKDEPKPATPPKEGGDDDEGEAGDTGPWSIPHGSKKYTATRADKAPVIDGVLDDAIWKKAPTEDHFLSTKSKPFGKPTTEPTTVQVAYDETYLYVAFRCRYGKPHAPNDSYAADERTLLDESEYVSVIVDAVHAHTGGYQFVVTPAGARADAEISDQGAAQNLDWHGLWDADTEITEDGWTAELAIPWGTMYMSSSDEPFDVGIEFERREPTSGEESLWALAPPATELYDVNFFGHVDGLERVHPGQRLLLLPFASLAFDSSPPTMQSRLTDFTGTNAQGRIYAGAYVRLRPPGPFRLDATFNPDFSAVNPDQATANFDRFELEYPEARAFFSEDAPRFAFGGSRYQFGDLGAQLFYSRRLGITTDTQGFTSIVPILSGVKSVFRDGGTEAAVMNVETVKPQNDFALADNSTVGRVTETIEGQRVGAIVLVCGACGLDASGAATQQYTSGGGDAQISLFERHLIMSGFYAYSRTGDNEAGSAGEGTVSWRSQDIYAKGTLTDIVPGFQAPLGFFETTGVRAETIAAGYTPVVRSDHVQQVFIEGQLSNVRDYDTNDLVYRRATISGSLQTIDGAQVQVAVEPNTENVTTPFPIGANAVTVPAGQYKVLGTRIELISPPNRTFVFGVRYVGGDLYDGTRNAPGAFVGVNLGRFTAKASYTFYLLKFPNEMVTFYGHDAVLTASYAYSPLARTAVVLEADTVAARASALVTTTYQFGTLSAATLSIRGASGSTADMPAMNTFDAGNVSAILSLQLGASPF